MFCPKCGAENAEGVSFCTACGNAMPAAPVEEIVIVGDEVIEAVPTPAAEEAPKKDLLAQVKSLLQNVTGFLRKNKLFVIGGLGILSCIICIVLLCAIFGGSNGYDVCKHSIEASFNEEGQLVILYDAKKANTTSIEGEWISGRQASMDGSILVVRTGNGSLAVVKGSKVTVIEEEVKYYVLSADGTGVAYVTNNDDALTLSLYNIKTKKTKVVTQDLKNTKYAISPDGDSVCYYEQKEGDEEASLMFFKGSKSTKVTSNDVTLIGLSNGGKYIYVMGEDDEGEEYLYSYNTKGGRNKIGKCNLGKAYFNADHTQILYYTYSSGSSQKSYISTNGKEGQKIASSVANPLLPSNVSTSSSRYATTIPTDNLYNKVYTCNNGSSIWYIRKNSDKSVKLVGGISDAVLSQDAKLVYYMDEGELKVLTVKKGDSASDKAKVLAEDVESFVVTSDCKKLYYISDNALYCVNGKTGKGKKTVANDEVASTLAINAKDVVYYIKDGDAYATKNGSKGKNVVSDAQAASNTANGVVYITTEDCIYATAGAKRPTKVYETD